MLSVLRGTRRQDLRVGDSHRHAGGTRLLLLLGVLDTTNRVLDLAFHLFGLAISLELGVADCLAGHFLDPAYDLSCSTDAPIRGAAKRRRRHLESWKT